MFFGGGKQFITGVYVLVTLLALWVKVVSGAGRFELQVDSVQNIKGRVQTGACCGGAGPGGVCAACATFARVCLKEFQQRVSAGGPCSYGATDTPVLGGNSFTLGGQGPGPDTGRAVVAFRFAWPRWYTLTVEVLNLSNTSAAGVLIARAVHTGVLAPGVGWRVLRHEEPVAQLRYRMRLLCLDNYHGPRCTRYCRPRDDSFGHYGCDAHGDKTCLEGWGGPGCTTAMCRQSCSTEHGYCKVPGECRCRYGWHGDLCDQCVLYPGCVHGSCTLPWQCLCDTNYGGQLCDKDLNSCGTRQPCLNGGSCSNTGPDKYTCSCPAGVTGTHCETGIDECLSLPCQHGGVCKAGVSGFRCVCPPQWTGKTCLIDADECEQNPCENAHPCRNLIGGYFCTCLPGWTGQNCDTNVHAPPATPTTGLLPAKASERSVPLLVAVAVVALPLLIVTPLLWFLWQKQKAHAGVITLPLPTATVVNNILTSTASGTREHLGHIKNAINTPAHRHHANNTNTTSQTHLPPSSNREVKVGLSELLGPNEAAGAQHV
ncbi:protein jagged-1a-like [Gadus macrocephalus]|uniref:protein jagged-1a-like n=1 Tax=Gadus macrocephalus TaxID=80720 RepID=UPI0028CBA301|nr:protein jagged-1a-like [Gadus macrocephalus]